MSCGGELGDREGFGSVIDAKGPEWMKGPDGIKFDAKGDLYVTVFGQGDVTVLGPDGLTLHKGVY